MSSCEAPCSSLCQLSGCQPAHLLACLQGDAELSRGMEGSWHTPSTLPAIRALHTVFISTVQFCLCLPAGCETSLQLQNHDQSYDFMQEDFKLSRVRAHASSL